VAVPCLAGRDNFQVPVAQHDYQGTSRYTACPSFLSWKKNDAITPALVNPQHMFNFRPSFVFLHIMMIPRSPNASSMALNFTKDVKIGLITEAHLLK
jgi:hypothetical protein